MGTVASLSAVHPDPAPTPDEVRSAFRDRIRASLVAPYPSVPAEFGLSLDGVWRDLLRAFSGGADADYPLNREWLLADSDAWPSPEGVWAVRGRRRAYPLWDRPGPPEEEHLNDVRVMFNDDGDVALIVAWLDAGPTASFVEYFRTQHERYVDGMLAEGASAAEIRQYAGGSRDEAPYLTHWNRLREFYHEALAKRLWVRSYIS